MRNINVKSYVSQILYHLVGSRHPLNDEQNFEILCKVLKSMEIRPCAVGEHHGPMTIRIDYDAALRAGEPIQQTVSCFCDIPRDHLQPVHSQKYGLFGVGVDRHIVASWGGRPVIYIPTNRQDPMSYLNLFHKEVMSIRQGLDNYFPEKNGTTVTTRKLGDPPKSEMQAIDQAKSLISKELLAFMKFFDVDLPEDSPENYYMEREWRKFGKLGLEMALREVIVAHGFGEKLRDAFPNLNAPIFELTR